MEPPNPIFRDRSSKSLLAVSQALIQNGSRKLVTGLCVISGRRGPGINVQDVGFM